MFSKLPLVVILGATSVGKTKLSLELVKKFGGEIIGADSMQVYKGLDIITAKATEEERLVAPHHMIDILNPDETFTVVEYRNKALDIINNLFSKNKLPIVVGGTNYYVESLLWKILVEEPGSKVYEKISSFGDKHDLPSEELHKQLKLLDPTMAKRLHPNNKRKILRALEVVQQKKRKLSDILEEQQKSLDGSSSGGGLRYANAIVLWLQCDQDVLDVRINERVDKMIEQGLVDELNNFHKEYNQERIKTNECLDYTKGIFQSIGFKEFHNYLLLDESLKKSSAGKSMLEEGIAQLKMVTRRYSKKQTRWINNRFLSRHDRKVPPVFALATTDLTKWDENVRLPAIEIIEHYIFNTPCKHQPLPSKTNQSNPNSKDDTFTCTDCNRIFIGKFQWDIHLKSNRHKKRLEKLRKLDIKQLKSNQ